MTTPLSRKALVLLAALLLATTTVSADSRPARAMAASPMDGFSRLWSVLTGFWAKDCGVDPESGCVPDVPKPTKNGCQIDPDGRCLPTKNGCQVDPNGRCIPAKNGCSVDPSGRCMPVKNGCQIDPSGLCVK